MEKFDIYNLLFWIFFLIALVLLAWRILGKTPGFESLIGALIASELALWKLMYRHGRELTTIGRELSVIKTNVRNSFQIVKKDTNSIRGDIGSMKKDINTMGTNINSDLKLIKKKLRIKS